MRQAAAQHFNAVLSTPARAAAALGVTAALTALLAVAGHASHEAVLNQMTAINGVIEVTLPTVEVVAKRDAWTTAEAGALRAAVR